MKLKHGIDPDGFTYLETPTRFALGTAGLAGLRFWRAEDFGDLYTTRAEAIQERLKVAKRSLTGREDVRRYEYLEISRLETILAKEVVETRKRQFG